MNRFFLTLIVIVFYSFSSNNNLEYAKNRQYVFDEVNNGRTIENDDSYKKFKEVADDEKNAQLLLISDVYISMAKYNLQQANYDTADKYFNQALKIIEIQKNLKRDDNTYSETLLTYFPIVIVNVLNNETETGGNVLKKLDSVYPKKDVQNSTNVTLIEGKEGFGELTKHTPQKVSESPNEIQIANYYSMLKAVKKSINLTMYKTQDINNFELYREKIPSTLLRKQAGLMLASYYIYEYKKALSRKETLTEDLCVKAARYISDFMIEYMDYESINKYIIKPKEGLEPFGDYMKSVNASVVLKDIEDAIIEYYFPELKTDTALPSSKLRDSEGEGLQVNQNPSKQIEQDRGLKRKADKVNLTKSSEEIESNIENKLEQKQTWGEWIYSCGKWLLGK